MTTIIKEHFVRSRKQEPQSLQKTGGTWITKPFKNRKKAVEKMRAYSKSDCRSEAELLAARARKEGSSIIQQLQIIGGQERIKNRSGIRVLLLCTLFLHGSTFLTLLILINWLIWSCPVVKI